MVQGGPGVFLVQAGGSIDLGSLKDGIQTVGNGNNALLDKGKSSLVIVSGYIFEKNITEIGAFFNTVRKTGDDYAQLMADGKADEAARLLQETRVETIYPLLDSPSGVGDINMTSSQIGTSIGQSDIFIIANGSINLGKTAMPVSGKLPAKTGITTGGGGGINIFSRLDVNVNESRIMTFFSSNDMNENDNASLGDITIWSDEGNINAGRGSRTAVSASPPRKDPFTGQEVFTPPAIGSGIRAATYGDNAPEPGNIHLFAPSGIIDAGEAGISGGKVILAAVKINNATNISFSTGSIGVSQATAGTAGIGNLSGAGNVTTQSSQLTSDSAGIGATRAAQASQMIDNIMTKWLDVKVIDFVEDDDETM